MSDIIFVAPCRQTCEELILEEATDDKVVDNDAEMNRNAKRRKLSDVTKTEFVSIFDEVNHFAHRIKATWDSIYE